MAFEIDISNDYALTIEGIPYVFTTSEDVAFAGLETKALLKVGHGLDTIVEQASRKQGVANTTEITVALGPDQEDFLLDLFAYESADTVQTSLDQTFDWDSDYCYVKSTDGFPNVGEFYIGKETVSYANKNDSSFWNLTRGEYGSYNNKYIYEEEFNKGSVYVRNRPRQFEGRVAKLYQGSNCIFAGPISSMPIAEDWVVWSFKIRDLTALLDTEIGGYKLGGEALGLQHLDEDELMTNVNGCFVEAGVNDVIKLECRYYGSPDAGDSWDLDFSIDTTLSTGYHSNIGQSVLDAIYGEMSADEKEKVSFFLVPPSTSGFVPEPWLFIYKLDTNGLISGAGCAANFRIFVDFDTKDSIFAFLGFTPDLHESEAFGDIDGVTHGYQTFIDKSERITTASDEPIYYQLTATSRYLPVVFGDKDILGFEIPDTGTLNINGKEVATYRAVDEIAPWLPNMRVFTLDERGGFQTEICEYKLRWEWTAEQVTFGDTEQRPVNFAWGISETNLMDLLLSFLISTGGNRYLAGDYAEYDSSAINEYQSVGLPGDYIDLESFDKYKTELLGLDRSLVFVEPVNIKQLIEQELLLLGLCLVPMRIGEYYRLALVNVGNLVNQEFLTLDIDGDNISQAQKPSNRVGLTKRPKVKHDLSNIINRVTVKPLYDFAQESQLDFTIVYNELDSQIEYSLKKGMVINLQSFGGESMRGTAIAICDMNITALLRRFASRVPYYELETDRRGFDFHPGDQVVFSSANMPTSRGTRGLTDEPVNIISIEKNYFKPSSDRACRILASGTYSGNFAYYSPSGKALSASGTTIILSDNYYSEQEANNIWNVEADQVKDILWFLGATKILIYNRGEKADGFELTVDEISYTDSKITTVETIPAEFGVNSIVCAVDWADVSDSQQKFAFIADNSNLLNDTDEGFRYG